MSKILSKTDIFKLLSSSVEGSGTIAPFSQSLPYEIVLNDLGIIFKIYIWNTIFTCEKTNNRPKDEYRINFNIYPRTVQWSPDSLPVYCGYCADYNVFILWDSRRHKRDISRQNMQIKESALISGFSCSYYLHDRYVDRGIETVIVCTPDYFVRALKERYSIYLDDLCSGRPEVVRTHHSNHNNYGPVFRFCKNNPTSSTFDVAAHFNISINEAAKVLNALYETYDYPRPPLSDEEYAYLRGLIRQYREEHPNITYNSILVKLNIPRKIALQYNLVPSVSSLDDFLEVQ